ncbi:MAG: hypothetical protein B7X93_09175 [Hydrogenophilales bacterium 17-61-9]|nr:MAG: hypothetical protein B7X93_09175 [Hydrogenophilales bacterium 17-61-9]
MYIVAIGWAYVILMMAITASTIGKAIAILIFLGVIPLGLFAYIFGRPKRRSMAVPDEETQQSDAADAQSNQR